MTVIRREGSRSMISVLASVLPGRPRALHAGVFARQAVLADAAQAFAEVAHEFLMAEGEDDVAGGVGVAVCGALALAAATIAAILIPRARRPAPAGPVPESAVRGGQEAP